MCPKLSLFSFVVFPINVTTDCFLTRAEEIDFKIINPTLRENTFSFMANQTSAMGTKLPLSTPNFNQDVSLYIVGKDSYCLIETSIVLSEYVYVFESSTQNPGANRTTCFSNKPFKNKHSKAAYEAFIPL